MTTANTEVVTHRHLQPREVVAAWLLRFDAMAHVLAGVVVFLPRESIQSLHAYLVGSELLPDIPILWYFARGLPAYYALHGAVVLFMSFDLKRYLDLIRFSMRAFAGYGLLMLVVDLQAGMPKAWTIAEPVFALVFSATVLWLLSSSMWENQPPPGERT